MFLLRMLIRRGRGQAMDPLQVSMTGVRMGERFLQIGCNDKALLGGLAAKVGLSGTAAVAVFSRAEAARAAAIGQKIGALIEVKHLQQGGDWPFEDSAFDMVVVDDTGGTFRGIEWQGDLLLNGWRALRPGGRIEVVTPVNTAANHADFEQLLSAAGFKPVRVLAERNELRFVEGLRPQS
jgi:SAM-dependent methyltransferase